MNKAIQLIGYLCVGFLSAVGACMIANPKRTVLDFICAVITFSFSYLIGQLFWDATPDEHDKDK